MGMCSLPLPLPRWLLLETLYYTAKTARVRESLQMKNCQAGRQTSHLPPCGALKRDTRQHGLWDRNVLVSRPYNPGFIIGKLASTQSQEAGCSDCGQTTCFHHLLLRLHRAPSTGILKSNINAQAHATSVI